MENGNRPLIPIKNKLKNFSNRTIIVLKHLISLVSNKQH